MADALGLENEDDFAAYAAAYVPIERMFKVHDKLHLLNYDIEFVKMTKLPRLHRLYFSQPTNPGEQYYNFVMLCAWLINKTNRPKPMELPQEYDDPNDVISKILANTKELGGRIDVSASKLKAGFGSEVITVLDFLADKALEGKGFEPIQIPEEMAGVDEEVDAKEINLAQIEEEMALQYEEDWKEDDFQPIGMPSSATANKSGPGSSQFQELAEEQQLIETNISLEEWRLELERVLPQLSQPINNEDNFNWRTRSLQIKACLDEIKDVMAQTSDPLQRLQNDIKDSIEKVHARETNLNSHLESILTEFAINNNRLQELREKQRKVTTEVNEKNKTLAKLSDDVEAARRKLDERGTVMADGAPVAQARKDLAIMKKEISDMDVEIGVMEHCILKAMVQEQISLFEHRV